MILHCTIGSRTKAPCLREGRVGGWAAVQRECRAKRRQCCSNQKWDPKLTETFSARASLFTALVAAQAYYYPGGNDLLDQDPKGDPTSGMKFRSLASGVGGGLPVLGFAAASTPAAVAAGLGLKPEQTVLSRDQVAGLTRVYVEWLAEQVVAAGVPPELVVNHVGGQQPVEHTSVSVF